MFYEEAVVNGVLCWRDKPDGEWNQFAPVELTTMLIEMREGRRKDFEMWCADAKRLVEIGRMAALKNTVGMGLSRMIDMLGEINELATSQGKAFAEGLAEGLQGRKVARVYVAGPYSASNVIAVLENIRNGLRASVQVLLAGFSPFCPWLDYQFQFLLYPGESLRVEDYYRYSIDWLEVSDAMLVLPGYESSKGTVKEIEIARKRRIPIFYSLEDLLAEKTRGGARC